MKLLSAGKPWTEDPNHPHYKAAKLAINHVFHVEPDMIREGGSIPITLTLQETINKNIILIPVGASDDGAHSQNEKIDIYNYIEGVRRSKPNQVKLTNKQTNYYYFHCIYFLLFLIDEFLSLNTD